LADNGIDYVEIDVDEDAEGRAKAEALNEGRLHTPTFECEAGTCVDFHPDRVAELVAALRDL
jgi:hypothetical protein